MRIAETYSHVNGLEFMLIRRLTQWTEIKRTIKRARLPNRGRSSSSFVQSRVNTAEFTGQFDKMFCRTAWCKQAVALDTGCTTLHSEPIVRELNTSSKNGALMTDDLDFNNYRVEFLKDRVCVALQFGKKLAGAYDLSERFFGQFISYQIDVGINILPMRDWRAQIGLDMPCFESELKNLERRARCVLAVPLVLVGVAL